MKIGPFRVVVLLNQYKWMGRIRIGMLINVEMKKLWVSSIKDYMKNGAIIMMDP